MRARRLPRLALGLLGALACDCSASPRTVTAAPPPSWPIPIIGEASAVLPFGGGLLLFEHDAFLPNAAMRISRVPPEGGLPSLVALNQEWRFQSPVIVGPEVFWAAGQPSQIRAAPTAGGTAARVLVTENGLIDGLAVDATHVYYLHRERVSRTPEAWTCAITRVARAGGQSEVVSPTDCARSGPGPVAVVDGKLYFATADTVEAISLADRESVVLARGLRPSHVRVDGADIYVLDRPSADAAADAALRVVPRTGGAVRTLVSGFRDPPTPEGEHPGFALTPTHVVLLDRFHQPRSQLVVVRRADGHVERRDHSRAAHPDYVRSREMPDCVTADVTWIYLAFGHDVLRERLLP